MKVFKGSKLYAIITGVCPVCHEESMYEESNPYKITKIMRMHERCSNCSTKYKIEPSFFYGAMYVSYPVGIIFASAAFLIAHYVLHLSLFHIFLAIVITMLVFMPVIMRVSRNIWINFFFKYNPEKAED